MMLQQTTTAVVVKYFERFLKRFPTVRDLANASEDDVLCLWEGLGYYRRARQLHRAAQVIVREYGGTLPQSVEHLMKLPGIGRYTAGAIVSLAFNRPAPILEANTRRLFTRWLGVTGIKPSQKEELLWEFAEYLLPNREPGIINQALMDLGHDICLPRQPRCDACPVAKYCRSFQQGSPFNSVANKTVATRLHEVAYLAEKNGRFLMVRHARGHRWGGLWDLPRAILAEDPSEIPSPAMLSPDLVDHAIRRTWPLRVKLVQHFLRLRYQVTRYRVVLDCYHARVLDSVKRLDIAIELFPPGIEECRWVPLEEAQRLPVPSSARRIFKVWQSRH
jgi:A/G-specific adenine glycosylase